VLDICYQVSTILRLFQELHKNESSLGLAVGENYIFSGVSRGTFGESHHVANFNRSDNQTFLPLEIVPYQMYLGTKFLKQKILKFKPKNQEKVRELERGDCELFSFYKFALNVSAVAIRLRLAGDGKNFALPLFYASYLHR
jgi:hypothetical protein